jgi:hypothetical protein
MSKSRPTDLLFEATHVVGRYGSLDRILRTNRITRLIAGGGLTGALLFRGKKKK